MADRPRWRDRADDDRDEKKGGSAFGQEARQALDSTREGLAGLWRRFRGFATREQPAAAPPPPWWVFVGIGLLVVTAAGLALAVSVGTAPPAPPFLPVGETEIVDPAIWDADRGLLFVRTEEDAILALVAPEDTRLVFCEDTGNVESPERVWNREGAALDGGPSLARRPVVVYENEIYLNPERSVEGPPGTDRELEPRCAGEEEAEGGARAGGDGGDRGGRDGPSPTRGEA